MRARCLLFFKVGDQSSRSYSHIVGTRSKQITEYTVSSRILFSLKGQGSCWHVSIDNFVQSIACELSAIRFGKDISIRFEISNKKIVCLYKYNQF